MSGERALFVCVHNSARSQMAEAFRKEPGALNPLVVEAMQELGLDISGNTTQSAFELFKAGWLFDCVIAVCDGATEAQCPVFPGVTRRWHWPFPDPEALDSAGGGHEELMDKVREIRDAIEAGVEEAFGPMLQG